MRIVQWNSLSTYSAYDVLSVNTYFSPKRIFSFVSGVGSSFREIFTNFDSWIKHMDKTYLG